MRTSKLLAEKRVSPNESRFDANEELSGIRSGGAMLAGAGSAAPMHHR